MVVLGRLMDVGGHAELFGFELFLWVGLALLGSLILGTLGYSLLTRVRRETPAPGSRASGIRAADSRNASVPR